VPRWRGFTVTSAVWAGIAPASLERGNAVGLALWNGDTARYWKRNLLRTIDTPDFPTHTFCGPAHYVRRMRPVFYLLTLCSVKSADLLTVPSMEADCAIS